jgi:hypothetical protein
MPEEEKEKVVRAPFYHTHTETGKPTKEMLGTREIIFILAKANKPLTKHAIGRLTDMPPANVGKYCRQLRKIGILDVEEVKHPSQSYWPYSLTWVGKLVALALDLSEKEGRGIDRDALTKELINTMEPATPMHKFSKHIYQTMIERGREDIVQEWFRRISETAYREGQTDPIAAAWLSAAGFDMGDKFVLSVINEAFSKLSRADTLATKLYIKQGIEQGVMDEIIRQNKGVEYFKEYIGDPDIIYIPFKCKRCGNYEPRRRTKIKELLVARMTGKSLFCNACRMTTKEAYETPKAASTATLQREQT